MLPCTKSKQLWGCVLYISWWWVFHSVMVIYLFRSSVPFRWICGIIYNKIYFPSFETVHENVCESAHRIYYYYSAQLFSLCFCLFFTFNCARTYESNEGKNAVQNYCSSLFVVGGGATAAFAVCRCNFLFIFILFHFCCMLHWSARISGHFVYDSLKFNFSITTPYIVIECDGRVALVNGASGTDWMTIFNCKFR